MKFKKGDEILAKGVKGMIISAEYSNFWGEYLYWFKSKHGIIFNEIESNINLLNKPDNPYYGGDMLFDQNN